MMTRKCDHLTCKDCANFIGLEEWNLYCAARKGLWLCYEDTPACEKYKPIKHCMDCVHFNNGSGYGCAILYMQLCSEDTRACIKFVEKGSNHA